MSSELLLALGLIPSGYIGIRSPFLLRIVR